MIDDLNFQSVLFFFFFFLKSALTFDSTREVDTFNRLDVDNRFALAAFNTPTELNISWYLLMTLGLLSTHSIDSGLQMKHFFQSLLRSTLSSELLKNMWLDRCFNSLTSIQYSVYVESFFRPAFHSSMAAKVFNPLSVRGRRIAYNLISNVVMLSPLMSNLTSDPLSNLVVIFTISIHFPLM